MVGKNGWRVPRVYAGVSETRQECGTVRSLMLEARLWVDSGWWGGVWDVCSVRVVPGK